MAEKDRKKVGKDQGEEVYNRPRSDEEALQRAGEPVEKEAKGAERDARRSPPEPGSIREEENQVTRAKRATSRPLDDSGSTLAQKGAMRSPD